MRKRAVFKLGGRQFLDIKLPLDDKVLMLIVKKALAARIPIIAAVGAPSSLAVATAREFGITLCGFVRNGKFNTIRARKDL